MRSRALSGASFERLSGSYVYSFINGGQDQGANIINALAAIRDHGTSTDELCGWDAIYPSRISPEARMAATRFKATELYVAETFEEVMTAIQLSGFIPIFAVQVGNRFTSLDANGVCGFDSGPGNHAVHGDGAKKLASGEWLIDMPNSWNLTFGQRGRGRLQERHIEGISYQECFVIRAHAEDPQEPNSPPVAK